jgi:phage terminase Nu1 subunit (DNA packaging protein)
MALVSVEKVAAALNVTPRRVQQLVELGLPREAHGEYDLGKCLVWYIRYLQAALERRDPDLDTINVALRSERQRLTKAQADREELELQRARSEVIPVLVFEERMSYLIRSARQRLLVLPARIAHQLVGLDALQIKSALARAVHDALIALSRGPIAPRVRPRLAAAPASTPATSANGHDRGEKWQ